MEGPPAPLHVIGLMHSADKFSKVHSMASQQPSVIQVLLPRVSYLPSLLSQALDHFRVNAELDHAVRHAGLAF